MHEIVAKLHGSIGALMHDLRPDLGDKLSDSTITNACVLSMLYLVKDNSDVPTAVGSAWSIATFQPVVANVMRSVANTTLMIDFADEFKTVDFLEGACISAFFLIVNDSMSPLQAYAKGIQAMIELEEK